MSRKRTRPEQPDECEFESNVACRLFARDLAPLLLLPVEDYVSRVSRLVTGDRERDHRLKDAALEFAG